MSDKTETSSIDIESEQRFFAKVDGKKIGPFKTKEQARRAGIKEIIKNKSEEELISEISTLLDTIDELKSKPEEDNSLNRMLRDNPFRLDRNSWGTGTGSDLSYEINYSTNTNPPERPTRGGAYLNERVGGTTETITSSSFYNLTITE